MAQPEARPGWAATLARMEGAYAPSSVQAYAREFSRFARWCEAEGRCAFPADGETVAGYVSHSFPSCARNTVVQRLRAIRMAHRLGELPDPTYAVPVQLAFRRGRREHGRPAKQAYGLTAELRDRLLAACPSDLLGLRAQLILRVGYDGLLRRSELIRLQVEGFERLPDGTGRVQVRRAKADDPDPRNMAYLSIATTEVVCAWLRRTGLERGPLVRALWRGQVLPGAADVRTVNNTIRLAARRAGVEPAIARRLTGHSLRVGAVQDLAASGRSLVEILRAGRWRHLSTVAHYVQGAPVNVWAERADTPAGGPEEKRLWRSAEQWAPRAVRPAKAADGAGD